MKPLNVLALLTFVGAFAAVLFIDAPATRRIQRAVGSLFSPFTRSGARVQDALTSQDEVAKSPEELKEENATLRREVDLLRLQQQQYEAIEKQNQEMSKALEFRRRYGFKLIPTEVINRKVSAWYREARLDKGLKQGIREESPVIMPVRVTDGNVERWEGALVGKIGRCEDDISTVVLITDETCRVAATVKGMASVHGILMGARGAVNTVPDLRLRFLKAQPVLPEGTQVVSDGIGDKGVFPYGILLGRVKEFVNRDGGGEAIVRPVVDLDQLRYVFVLQRTDEPTASTAPTPPATTAAKP
jgi:rod shape-determining protein MreC